MRGSRNPSSATPTGSTWNALPWLDASRAMRILYSGLTPVAVASSNTPSLHDEHLLTVPVPLSVLISQASATGRLMPD
jgi:hypothetical protein